jgi:hypothetical protein
LSVLGNNVMIRLLSALFLSTAWACSGADGIMDMDPASRLSGDEKKAWETFFAGVKSLQDEGDRNRAAELFERVANEFPRSRFAEESKELGGLLRQMLEEERHWIEPAEPQSLPLEQKIAYYAFHLRDVNCYQMSQPGMCYLLGDFSRERLGTNAAMKLKEIGEPAIPALIKLLEDRRPTRSVGYWRDFDPSRTILRFQDAAIQILDELLPVGFYRRSSTSSYFSIESSQMRSNMIGSIQTWHERSLGKTEVEKLWLAVEAAPGIYQLMRLLKDLALEHGQKERVLSTLHQMATKRNPLQLPQISELMCVLGDYEKVGAVASAYIAGEYDVGTSLPDDSAPGSNGQDSVLRQVILYGTDLQRRAIQKNAQRKNDPLQKERALFSMLVDTANENWRELPKTYDRDRFPLQMLVDALSNKEKWSSMSRNSEHWTIRRCDEAAAAIQKFTGQQFGFDKEKSEKEKDEAILRILAWWKKRSMKPVE